MNNKKGEIIIECDFPNEHRDSSFSVDCNGHNEGSMMGCKTFGEVEEEINNFLMKYPKAKIINNIGYGNPAAVTDNYLQSQTSLAQRKTTKKIELDNSESESDCAKEPTQEDINKQAEEDANNQLKKTLKLIGENTTTEILEQIYSKPKEYVKMVAKKNSRGFLLWGPTGLGKTYAIFRSFEEIGEKFEYLSGHITPLELYHFLFKNKDKNIVLDDVNILNDEINLNMLKSCLSDKPSIVNYNTSSPRLKVPSKFHFTGTITLLLNSKPKLSEDLRAVEGRILNHEIKLSYIDKIKVISEISKQDYKDLTLEQRQEVVKWIEENTSASTENLNLRVLFQIYEMYRYDKSNWKELALGQIKSNKYIDLILQGMNSWEWGETTGKSRRTYFRYKKKAEEQKLSMFHIPTPNAKDL